MQILCCAITSNVFVNIIVMVRLMILQLLQGCNKIQICIISIYVRIIWLKFAVPRVTNFTNTVDQLSR